MKRPVISLTVVMCLFLTMLLIGCQQQASQLPTPEPRVKPAPTPTAVTQPEVVLFISDTPFQNVSPSPTFKWSAPSRAMAYEFFIAKDKDFVNVVDSRTGGNALMTTYYTSPRTFEYATTYYWRVRAIATIGSGKWGGGSFTTIPGASVVAQVPTLPPTIPAPPDIEIPTPTAFVIKDSMDVIKISKDMVLDKNFSFDKTYFDKFVRTVACKQIMVVDRKIVYDPSYDPNPEYSIYVCYPTTDVKLPAFGVCFKHDAVANTDKVLAFFQDDAMNLIKTFGGTPGTKEKGWY